MRIRYPEGQLLVLTRCCAECGAGLYLALGRVCDDIYNPKCRNSSVHHPAGGSMNSPVWQAKTSPAPSGSYSVQSFTYA
jgi:hypothetical protein